MPNEAQNRKTAIARIQYMLDEGVFELFDRWRGPLWRGALTLLNSYPVSGIGCGAYIIDVANTDRDFFLYNTPQSAENYILQVAAEFGWVGIGFILWIFVILAASIVRAMRRNEEDIKEKWFYWGT
ncbi:MAG: O-antigen ligase family protein, partial [Candidatus Aminicenantes bacterium]|nr:O-antigen ligase family protein [Candidatus Aminicenantes bacterium]